MARFVTRTGWKARPPTRQTARALGMVTHVCYHHTAGPQPSLTRTGASIVRDVQTMHMDSRGYSDIAYNALIGPGGKIYEGRDLHVQGAHSSGNINGHPANTVALGICFLGNFQGVHTLSDDAKESALLLEYLWGLKVGRPLKFVTHRETKATACAGDNVQAWVEGRRG